MPERLELVVENAVLAERVGFDSYAVAAEMNVVGVRARQNPADVHLTRSAPR